MPHITSVSRDEDGELSYTFSTIDHTTHYAIYCKIKDHSRFVKFEEYDFRDEECIFYKENNNSIIKSWKNIIDNQIKEIEDI